MAKYIDKDKVVEEIERQISAIDNYPKLTDTLNIQIAVLEGNKVTLTKLLSFLNTLEVKEVDLEKEIDHYFQDNWPFEEEMCDMVKFAKHFYELGLKAQKGD